MSFAYQVIQSLINHHKYTSYLEVGCCADWTFDRVVCTSKVGIDPVKGGTLRIASDDYFAQNPDVRYDIIFIDGYHHHDQVNRDIKNALAALNPGGSIVLHDCNPVDLPHEGQGACGTAWRAIVKWRERADLRVAVGDFDHGVGVIRLGTPEATLSCPKSMDELCYDDLIANRASWLNLKSFGELVRWATA